MATEPRRKRIKRTKTGGADDRVPSAADDSSQLPPFGTIPPNDALAGESEPPRTPEELIRRAELIRNGFPKQSATADLVGSYFYVVTVAYVASQRNDARARELVGENIPIANEIMEWLSGRRFTPSEESILEDADEWIIAGRLRTVDILAMVDKARMGRPGPPLTVRAATVKALDDQRANHLSWTKVTQAHCDCGRTKYEHNSACKDKIRKRVGELDRFLKSLSRWRQSMIDYLHGDNPSG